MLITKNKKQASGIRFITYFRTGNQIRFTIKFLFLTTTINFLTGKIYGKFIATLVLGLVCILTSDFQVQYYQ